jgi:TATA-box binding protein (TBP) (component of TFIID and TFIIIB)
VIQDFHVPQGIDGDEAPKRLSYLTQFDLVILEFETAEHNKALAPGMHQVVWTRIEEKKPVWIFFRSGFGNIASCNEQSPGLSELFTKHFKQIVVKADQKIIQSQNVSKNLASSF